MPWPLPEVPFPPDTVCIQVRVPNDPAYLDVFFGQMLDMAAAFNWANDDAHTAIKARDRCRQMYLELSENNCPVVPALPPPCSDCGCEDCMNFRQQNCILQVQDCLTGDWVTIYDGSQCTPNPAPGSGASQPVGGSSADICLSAEATALTPLPWLVNAGDTLNFTTVEGSGTDGASFWYCPDGSIFFLGACAGGGGLNSGDPLNTTKHMALLLKVGSSYYPLPSGVFTVPSGVTNSEVFVQTNSASLGSNSGKYNICVIFQNNQAPPVGSWCRYLDLSLSAADWTFVTNLDANGQPYPTASFVPGSGFSAPWGIPPPATSDEYALDVRLDLGAAWHVTEFHTMGVPGSASGGTNVWFVQGSNDPTFASGVTTYGSGTFTQNGMPWFTNLTGLVPTVRYLRVLVEASGFSGVTQPGLLLQTVTIKGAGAGPVVGADCP